MKDRKAGCKAKDGLRVVHRNDRAGVPAYERLRDDARMGARVRDIVVKGVSMRKYEQVLPEVAGTVGVSKSAVSRRFIEASAAQLAALNDRPLADAALLAIYIDGIIVDGTHSKVGTSGHNWDATVRPVQRLLSQSLCDLISIPTSRL